MKRLHGYILKVSTKLSRCKSVKMQARNCWELIWVDTDKSVDPVHKTLRQGIQDEEARHNLKSLYLHFSCSLQCHLLKL